jgi:hypothetical protein
MPLLTVPEIYKLPLKDLALLNGKSLENLFIVLQKSRPGFNYDTFLEEVLSSLEGVDEKEKDIVKALISTGEFWLSENISLDDFVDSVILALENDESLGISDDLSKILRQRLAKLLGNFTGLRKTHLISRKMADHPKIYSNSEVNVDIRPTFLSDENDDSEKVIALSTFHTLRIDYRDLEGEKEFYVTLNSEDLEMLFIEISLAIEREEQLQNLLLNEEIIKKTPILRARRPLSDEQEDSK